MTDSLYDGAVLLLGEPTNMTGQIVLYLMTTLFAIICGIWGTGLSLLILKRILR